MPERYPTHSYRCIKQLVKLVALLLLFIFSTSGVFAQFHQVHIEPTVNHAVRLSFYAPNEGFVAFNNYIGYTTDSGKTYIQRKITNTNVDYNGNSVNLTFGFTINGVKAFDKNSIFVYGDYGFQPTILHSTDGGNTFKVVFFVASILATSAPTVTDVVFPQNGNIGYAVYSNYIIKTSDGGLTWVPNLLIGDINVTKLQFFDDTHGFAFGPGAVNILKTTDGGNWQFVHKPAGTLNCAYFLDASRAWACNNDGTIYSTQDGGTNWAQQNTQPLTGINITKMQFVNDSTGYAVANGFEMYKTSNSGKIWERLPRTNTYHYLGYSLTDFQLLNNFTWAAGGHGYVELSPNNGGPTVPAALFAVDTAGYFNTGLVKLVNYSKSGNKYTWYVNGKVVATAYNASYTRDILHITDTVTLITANSSGYKDTLTLYPFFHPQLVVNGFTPTAAKAGDVVTITGVNFQDAVGVSFGHTAAASFTEVSPTTITAVVGAGASGAVTVYSPFNFGAKNGFTFIPGPTIASVTPTSATAGTTITITGTNFSGATAVSFGGLPAISFTVVSSTQITAVLGAGNSGNITITGPGGTGSIAGFNIIPLISSISPTSGTFNTIINIIGTGFSQTSAVTIGGLPAQSFVVNSETSVTVVAAGGATGNVIVTTPSGTAAISSFTYYNKPVVTTFSPQSGPVGTVVTITGTNFSTVPSGNNVFFGAVKATILSASSTVLKVTVPSGITYTPLIVESNHLFGYGKVPFTLTFANGGGFGAKSFSTAPGNVLSPTAGTQPTIIDLDGDGKPDIATLNPAINGVSVLINTGQTGTLSYKQQDIGNLKAAVLCFADMDGDGKPDLVTQDGPATGIIIVYRNLSAPGNIAFGQSISIARYNLSGNALQTMAVDMDNDGKPDIVITDGGYADNIRVYRNRSEPGKLAFDPEADLDLGNGPYAVIGDIDGDGKPDVIAPFSQDDNTHWFVERNISTPGNFAFQLSNPLGPYLSFPISLGDIDGDGKTDVITDDAEKNELIIYHNLSTQGNISFAPEQDYQTGAQPGNTAISDLDGDGKPDIAVNCIGANKISVYKNISTPGKVQLTLPSDYATGANGGYMSIGDLDGDGKNDLLFSLNDQSVNVLLNNVKPSPVVIAFTPARASAGTTITLSGINFTGTTAVSFGGTPATSFTVNSDQTITAVLGKGTSGNISVTNAYDTTILPGFVYGLPPIIQSFTPKSGPVGTAVTITGQDFNPVAAKNMVYLGGVKAVVTSATATQLIVTAPPGATYQPISVVANNLIGYSSTPFDITFANTDTAYNLATFTQIYKTAGNAAITGDIDGDGKLDLVYQGPGWLYILQNTSVNNALSFASAVVVDPLSSPVSLYLADIDADGKLDIIELNGSSVTIYKNTTTGSTISFAASVTVTDPILSGKTLTHLAIADIDGDGLPDIAATDPATPMIVVFHNTTAAGKIAFGPAMPYSVTVPDYKVALADMDGDGKPEIVIGSDYYGGVVLLKNISSPGNIGFITGPGVNMGGLPYIADLDGDGKPDVIVGAQNTGMTNFYRNTTTGSNITYAQATTLNSINSGIATLGDFNGDGKPDYFSGSDFSSNIQIFPNTTAGSNLTFKTPFILPKSGNFIALGDLDGDGKPEVIGSTTGTSGQIIIFSSKRQQLPIADTNFKVSFIGTSCIGSKNGTIAITAAQNLPYTAIIIGANFNSVKTFTNTLTIPNLDTGAYSVCITATGYTDFEQCFNGSVKDPAALSVYAVVDNENKTVHLTMAGGQSYSIQINDAVYQTTAAEMNVPLQKGNNEVTVSTGKDCQGIYKQRITLGNDISIYPNPFVGNVQMDVGTSQALAGKVEIVDMSGRTVFKDNAVNSYGKLNLDLSGLNTGVYVVKLTIDNKQTVYKIWKQ